MTHAEKFAAARRERIELGEIEAALNEHPGVGEAAVTAMAANVCGVLGADVSVAVTGVAGPDPQEGEEPGTVWMATCVDGVVDVVRTRWPFDRTRIRQFTVITVLDALRLRLLARAEG